MLHFTQFFRKELRNNQSQNPELVENLSHFLQENLNLVNVFTFKPNAMKFEGDLGPSQVIEEDQILEERRKRESMTTFAFGSSTLNVHGSNTDIWSAADRSPSRSSTAAPQGSHLVTQSMYATSSGLRRETYPSESAGARARSTTAQDGRRQ